MSQTQFSSLKALPSVLVLFASLFAANSRAQSVDVPLNIDLAQLHQQLSISLQLDSQGRGTLNADDCNRLELAELQLESGQEALLVELDITAHTGLDVFGRCSGPSPFSGRMKIRLVPRAASDGRAVLFQAVASELQDRDGSEGLLARATRTLTDGMVLPQLDTLRVDLDQSIDALDQLIEDVSGDSNDNVAVLKAPTRLLGVEVVSGGLRTNLRFSVNARPGESVPDTSAPALDPQELLQWQRIEDEFDGFVTTIVSRLAAQLDDRDLQLDLLAVLLDTRHHISEALTRNDSGPDPVRGLFLSTWTALRPLLERLDGHNISDDVDFRLASFIAAGDLLTAVDALGPQFGIEISRDGMRRLARILLQDPAPASFTPLPLLPDVQLRGLFELGQQTRPESAARQPIRNSPLEWLFPAAHASSAPLAEALRGLVPAATALESYLDLVARLLEQLVYAHYQGASRVPAEYRDMFDPMLRATAWKESCWRHYIGTPGAPEVIRSAGGAVGMMQINARVWRGVYDLNRLEREVEYNVQAGMEILEHYMIDYALRRGEHQQPGGRDNLVRASYAAYNGGPSHLGRYRNPATAPRLRAIDQAFWHDYQQMKEDRWPSVQRCFSTP